MAKRLDVLVNDGSPLGVTEKTMRGEDGRLGVGGAEMAMLTLCGAWQRYGYDVTLYNNPRNGDGNSSFPQRTLDEFVPSNERDILVIFRSPNSRSYEAKGKKVWFSTDQYTIGNFAEFAGTVHKIVTISKFHDDYFKNTYGINNTVSIDLPVRTWEYRQNIEKVKHRCIFTSVPDRGLHQLRAMWPRIVEQVPDASLVITSDWRLWSDFATEDMTMQYRLPFVGMPSVQYLGAVPRNRLVEEQLKADLFLHPCIYSELFCIACSEAQVAGAFPVTSHYGALNTTNMGMVVAGEPNNPIWQDVFVSKVVELLNSDKLKENQETIKELAIKRFSTDKILEQWERVFINE